MFVQYIIIMFQEKNYRLMLKAGCFKENALSSLLGLFTILQAFFSYMK
jgi:hypothetical protein